MCDGGRVRGTLGFGVLAPAVAGIALCTGVGQVPTRAVALDLPMTGMVQLENSTDVTSLRGSFSSDVTLTISPLGEGSGPRVALTGALSRYSYWTDPARQSGATGVDRAAELLLGYAFVAPGFSVVASAGPTFVSSYQSFAGRAPATSSSGNGLKYKLSLFATPYPKWMVYSQVSYSTYAGYFSSQGKIGYAFIPNIYVGPEVAFSRVAKNDQFRAGGHISGFRLGPLVLSLSGGLVHDGSLGLGVYALSSAAVNF